MPIAASGGGGAPVFCVLTLTTAIPLNYYAEIWYNVFIGKLTAVNRNLDAVSNSFGSGVGCGRICALKAGYTNWFWNVFALYWGDAPSRGGVDCGRVCWLKAVSLTFSVGSRPVSRGTTLRGKGGKTKIRKKADIPPFSPTVFPLELPFPLSLFPPLSAFSRGSVSDDNRTQ